MPLSENAPALAYVLIQEGGSSRELYLHVHDSPESADVDRQDCAQNGSYRTSPVLTVPRTLVDHPQFAEFAEQLLQASLDLAYPTDSADQA